MPDDAGWVFEPKYDGIRILAVAGARDVRLLTRNGNDKVAQFPEIAGAIRELIARSGSGVILDGELIALAPDGSPDRFQALQGRIHSSAGSAQHSRPAALVVFDVLAQGAERLTSLPWTERRARLEQILGARQHREDGIVRLGAVERERGARLLDQAADEGWEGIVAKRADAPYLPGRRTSAWRKIKLESRQEFVIAGFTAPRGSRQHIGSLLLGHYDEAGTLVYAGHVGTGFSAATLRTLRARLTPLIRPTVPFATVPRTNDAPTWVEPELIAEVRFNEWTTEGSLRHPVFLGVRDDKAAGAVRREPSVGATPTAAKGAAKGASKRATARPSRAGAVAPVAGSYSEVVERLREIEEAGGSGTLAIGRSRLPLTNLGKVFYPEPRFTKGDLLRYYATVADVLLPAIADRPLVLRRHPNGITGKAFYQQQAPVALPDGVRAADVALPPGESVSKQDREAKRRFVGGALATLLYTIQLGAISVDPWHGRIRAPQFADWSIIDLDPGEGATFQQVVAIAVRAHEVLTALGLTSMVKTSGASGLHVTVPLRPRTPATSARLLAEIVATTIARELPRDATVVRGVARRPRGTVYVDYLQNIPGKTVASVYAARAEPAASVSTPLEWDELTPSLDPREFTITTLPGRLATVGDLWGAGLAAPNDLRAVMADWA